MIKTKLRTLFCCCWLIFSADHVYIMIFPPSLRFFSVNLWPHATCYLPLATCATCGQDCRSKGSFGQAEGLQIFAHDRSKRSYQVDPLKYPICEGDRRMTGDAGSGGGCRAPGHECQVRTKGVVLVVSRLQSKSLESGQPRNALSCCHFDLAQKTQKGN